MSADAVAEAVDAGASYLLRRLDARGKFVYRENMSPAVKLTAKYNWLRHAGTIYLLATFARWNQSADILPRLHTAAEYLLRTTLMAVPVAPPAVPVAPPGLLAVWSLPKHTGAGGVPKAKLGGSGIGLVGLLTLHAQSPLAAASPEVLHGLGKFVCSLQRTDGSFRSVHYLHPPPLAKPTFTSLYYPGEAALGLVLLYETTRNETYLTHARRALAYLCASRRGRAAVPADHWALLATQLLLPHMPSSPATNGPPSGSRGASDAGEWKRSSDALTKEVLYDHAATVVRSIGRGHATILAAAMTTPLSTRLEGLLAAHAFLPEAQFAPDRRAIEAMANASVRVLLGSQVRAHGPSPSARFAGAFPRNFFGNPAHAHKRSVTLAPSSPLLRGNAAAAGATLRLTRKAATRNSELRIDYNQHAISALMRYHDMLRTARPQESYL